MKATNVKLSSETLNAIGTWSGSIIKADKSKTKAIDSLYTDGVTADMLKAPGKDEPRTLYDSVQIGIVLGFTVNVQALLKKDTKTLSDAQKQDKRYWQQQIGSKLKDLRNALSRRERDESGEAEAEADKVTWESTKRKVIAEIITQAQKKESSTIKDMAAFIKDLQSALARIPANA